MEVIRQAPIPTSFHNERSLQSWYGRDSAGFRCPSYSPERHSNTHLPRDYYSQRYNAPRMPPSPPMEPPSERASHMSLPPISTLLEFARSGSGTSDQTTAQQQRRPYDPTRADAARIDTRPSGPPTPPMHTHKFDYAHGTPLIAYAPTTPASVSHPSPRERRSSYYPARRSPAHHHHHHQRLSSSSYSTAPLSAQPISPQSVTSALPESMSAPGRLYPPTTLSQQRPLPTDFPPRIPPSPVSARSTSSHASDRDRWQSQPVPSSYSHPTSQQQPSYPTHSASSSQSIPATPASATQALPGGPLLPDRYICPSCAKAFSRPSSLRIHVHSHTGEKPFRCPHAGCGKAFSVRSNMKRHQRGCHVDGGVPSHIPESIDY